MEFARREILCGLMATVAVTGEAAPMEDKAMFGMIGKMITASGKRSEVISLLLQAVSAMPGCLSYVVAQDTADENGIWITEVWDSKDSHDASLALPEVRKTIAAARPMIAGFSNQVITTPVGGYGIPAGKARGDGLARMNLSRENLPALVLLLAVLVVNAAGLWPEMAVSRVDLNDNVFHFTLTERMVQAVERGENPLDCWSPEWSLGYPVLRTYQPLAHALVVLAYFALGKSVGLMTVFVWVRFLSVVLLPLSFFAAARLMGLRPLTAAAAAILAPLVSTNFLYGIEYGSYTWAGSGLFPQAVGSHFLLITLGLAFSAIRRGRRLAAHRGNAGAHLPGPSDLRIHGRAFGLSAGGDTGCRSGARGSHPARGHGGGDGAFALGISVGAALARRLQHQSQPLGVGLEVGFLRRRPGIEMAVHRGIAGLWPAAGAHAAGAGRRGVGSCGIGASGARSALLTLSCSGARRSGRCCFSAGRSGGRCW